MTVDRQGDVSEATFAVLPVKRFGDAKSRLASGLDTAARRILAEAMLGDVAAQIAGSELVTALIVVTSEPRVAELGLAAEIIDTDADRSHSAAAAAGVAWAVARGATTVALLAGDCPTVTAAEIDGLIGDARRDHVNVAIAPDRDGRGTNALVLTPPTAIAPAFGPGSHLRHTQLAHEAGCVARSFEVPGLLLDIDTDDDFAELAQRMAEPDHLALSTENAVAEIMLNRHRLPGGLAR